MTKYKEAYGLTREVCRILGLKNVTEISLSMGMNDPPKAKATFVLTAEQTDELTRLLKGGE